MSIGAAKRGSAAGGLWRRLTSIAVAYALVIQTIFVAFAGAHLAANGADDGAPVFELCLNGPHDGPLSPVDVPGHQGDNHCVFCFSGAIQALAAPPHSSIVHVEINAGAAWWAAPRWPVPLPSRYAKARPRGPPLSA